MAKERRRGIECVQVVRGVCVTLVLLGACGCTVPGVILGQPDVGDGNGTTPIDGGDGSETTDGNRDMTLTSPIGKTSGEPNDSFDEPIVAVFDTLGVARLQGTIDVQGDLDVYLLGRLNAGDHIEVDVSTSGSVLDSSVALFDLFGRLVYSNDDRGGEPGRFLDSLVTFTVRRSSEAYFLVVTNAAFAGLGQFTGAYFVDLQVTSGFAVPQPVPQILMLNFAGGRITSPALGPLTLAPFSADMIRNPGSLFAPYAGQTQALKDAIRQTIEQNFQRFNVAVVTSDEPPLPVGTEFSTIHLGGFDPMAFGVAESVDLFNADFCDDAIIFTEGFAPLVFSTLPSVQALGVAIGNIAAHEAGHLLGLNHVDDDAALMDDRSAADAFLLDQEFKESPLSRDIMDIGTQDAVLLLEDTVGLFSL